MLKKGFLTITIVLCSTSVFGQFMNQHEEPLRVPCEVLKEIEIWLDENCFPPAPAFEKWRGTQDSGAILVLCDLSFIMVESNGQVFYYSNNKNNMKIGSWNKLGFIPIEQEQDDLLIKFRQNGFRCSFPTEPKKDEPPDPDFWDLPAYQ